MLKKVTKILLVLVLVVQMVSPVITVSAAEAEEVDEVYTMIDDSGNQLEEVELETSEDEESSPEVEIGVGEDIAEVDPDDDTEYTEAEGEVEEEEELNEGLRQIGHIFPDPVLARIVAEELNLTVESYILVADLAVITHVIGTDDGATVWDVRSLEGIQHLVNAETLQFGFNYISDISPLSSLNNLRRLEIWHNQISDISPLSNLTNLEILHLGDNRISDISPLSSLINLRRLGLANNQISDISPLSNLTNLEVLRLDNNRISDISSLSNLTNLERLSLERNQITDLRPLGGLNIRELSAVRQIVILPTVTLGESTQINLFLPDGSRMVKGPEAGVFSRNHFDLVDGNLFWHSAGSRHLGFWTEDMEFPFEFSGQILQEVLPSEDNDGGDVVWTDEEMAIAHGISLRFQQARDDAWELFRYVEDMYLEGTLSEHPNGEELYRLLNAFREQIISGGIHSHPDLPFDHEWNVSARAELVAYTELFEYFTARFTMELNYETENSSNDTNTLPQTGTDVALNTMLAGSGLAAVGGLAAYKKLKKD